MPRVRIYDGVALAAGQTVQTVPGFLAFNWQMQYGVNAAVGDVNGDGFADLAVSLDIGGHSKVRVWSGATIASNATVLVNALPMYQEFFANGLTDRNGIRLVVRDINGDGKAEVVTSAASGSLSLASRSFGSATRLSKHSRRCCRSAPRTSYQACMWDRRHVNRTWERIVAHIGEKPKPRLQLASLRGAYGGSEAEGAAECRSERQLPGMRSKAAIHLRAAMLPSVQSRVATSPPARVLSPRQVDKSMLSRMNRTEPSARRRFTPPV